MRLQSGEMNPKEHSSSVLLIVGGLLSIVLIVACLAYFIVIKPNQEMKTEATMMAQSASQPVDTVNNQKNTPQIPQTKASSASNQQNLTHKSVSQGKKQANGNDEVQTKQISYEDFLKLSKDNVHSER